MAPSGTLRQTPGMANRLCWKCSNKSHMTMHGVQHAARDDKYPGIRFVQAAFICDECQWLSIAWAPYTPRQGSQLSPNFLESGRETLTWIPTAGEFTTYDDVPAHIAEAASEAHLCHSVDAYRASVLLARAVIEATAKDKGITNGRLVQKIDAMHEAELIRKIVKEGAHEVRYLGNDMAHGDFVDPIEAEESEEVLELMAEVLHDVYQQDARVNRSRARREAKKAGGGNGVTTEP